jgi:crotonobetaine/carnitine-CoA ligase
MIAGAGHAAWPGKPPGAILSELSAAAVTGAPCGRRQEESVDIVGPRTLRRQLEAMAGSDPTRTWLIFEDRDGGVRRYTYAEFARRVQQAAGVLAELGLRPGDKLVLHLANCPEFLFLWFGASYCGAEIVPVNTLSSLDELEYLVNHSESVLFVTEPAYLESVERLLPRCPNVRYLLVCRTDEDRGRALSFSRLLDAAADAPPEHDPKPLDVVAILYTSGTTSKPKGCLITIPSPLRVSTAAS